MIPDLPICPPPGETIVIPAPEQTLAEGALGFVLEPFQPLREQFSAITGIGLEPDDAWPGEQGRTVRQMRLARGDGQAQLGYLAAGQPGGRRVIFLHGSPGTAEEWDRFLLDVPLGQYHLAVDRPGFGASGEEPEIDLAGQAAAVAPLLTAGGTGAAVLVGYSYGGPVALRLAADYPDRIAGVLLIGAAADPALEETHPLQQLAALDFFAGLLPTELANANAELMNLRPGLEELTPDLARITAPVTIVQGLADTLVPPENVGFLQAHLPASPGPRVILIEEADHFLPWTHADLLRAALGCVIGDGKLPSQSPELPPSSLSEAK
ncbi:MULTISPECIES: alpha/beta fold hydrolase [Paracoccus]|jgi:pimeloyl-ACP methyl ester carboxylesterase|uniref:alpha/beta fold hydrolase n=1 Tax=Paracoccus TaxID=265 RepID=UPI002583D44E|nr:alpha/beta hydrolase [Paracoccus sp. (in: a-proteobacteria)]